VSIIAVKEPPFLTAVQRVIGGIEVKDQQLWSPVVRLQKNLRADLIAPDRDIGYTFGGSALEPVSET
jgi:hypothetical protein